MALINEDNLRPGGLKWTHAIELEPRSYACGWCGRFSGSNLGFEDMLQLCRTYICTYCAIPTVFYQIGGTSSPVPAPGSEITALPSVVESAWSEARNAFSVGAYTATALMCRKILMNVSADKGAKEGLSFVQYVKWLSENHFIPPHVSDLADHVRKAGNEATHEIVNVNVSEASLTVKFTQAILQIIYELPSLLPRPTQTPTK